MGGVSRGGAGRSVRVVAVILSLTILLGARPAAAEEEGFFGDVGIGLGTALVNVLYIPAKFTYATVGSLIGGLAWVLTLGDTDTAMGVWEPTLGGSYVVTPSMLRGDEPVEFSGGTITTRGSNQEEVVEETEEVEIREYDTRPPGE
jgi:hypothetical protein